MEQGSLLFVLSEKDTHDSDKLLSLCQSGRMVETLLLKFRKTNLLKPNEESIFRMTLTKSAEGKAGKRMCHYFVL